MTGLVAVSGATVAVIAAIVLIDLYLIFLILSAARTRRSDEAAATGAAEAVPASASESAAVPEKVMPRREFFGKAWLASLGLFALQFGAASIAFLWPTAKGGFGSKITVGSIEDIKAAIAETGQPLYYGAGRVWITAYDGEGKDAKTGVDYEAEGVLAEGLMPLDQRCTHLKCRVPFCASSQWFECPCHGSKFNDAGEWKAGPAPRGMDRFRIEVVGGQVVVDTSEVIPGPGRGTDTTGQAPEGPFCA